MKFAPVFYFLIFCCFLAPYKLLASKETKNNSDTIRPFVLLGHYFEDNQTIQAVDFAHFIDSIVFHENLSSDEKSSLLLFKNLYNDAEDDFLDFIDSLLDLETVDNSLLMAVQYFKAFMFNEDNILDDNALIMEPCISENSYPANTIYRNIWCNKRPSPYPPDLASDDTLVSLKLINSDGDFHPPCFETRVTSKYGWRNGRMHHGIDIGVGYSLPIYSVFAGTVRFAKFYQGYGRLVIIRHHNGMETYYAHLSRIHVREGQEINAGDILGLAGNSGASNGTHLHFEMRYKGIPLNPAHIISFRDSTLIYPEIILKKNKSAFFVYNENAILYTIQRGDYLHKIANEFGITVNRLCEINDISRNHTLRVGQILRIEL